VAVTVFTLFVQPGESAQDASLKDFLPVPPKEKNLSPYLGEDLTKVPEVSFEHFDVKLRDDKDQKEFAGTIAKINHLNAKKADGFMELLLLTRADLRGLPFTLGEACRMKPERSKQFSLALAAVRNAIPAPTGHFYPTASREFWEKFQAACLTEDQRHSSKDYAFRENVTLARIAALMQVFGLEWEKGHLGLVQYLSGIPHKEASRALAKIALFSSAKEVEQAAATSLKKRQTTDYADILVQGLRYPWPPVARRAARTMSQLQRSEFVLVLLAFLDEPDPRMPVLKERFGQKAPVIRELVRMNHHRNCLLCHAPGSGKISENVVRAPMPIPGESFAPFARYYNADPSQSFPDILVRADVTYLRQDFSVLQKVADFTHPWPLWQRFDFVVRSRTLTEPEAEDLRQKFQESEQASPYQTIALAALRDLTGRDAGPTASAWRKLLALQTIQP
jgi:hypothetical protein